MHALGIATLGTPFVFARPESHMVGKSLDGLLDEAPKHTELLAGAFAWVVGLPVALPAENWLPRLGFKYFRQLVQLNDDYPSIFKRDQSCFHHFREALVYRLAGCAKHIC